MRVTADQLRKLGFGYRAEYIARTAETLFSLGGADFLDKLQKDDSKLSSEEKALTLVKRFHGVGPRVAALVVLQSLRGYDAIPVDTHIHQIYTEVYAADGDGDDDANLKTTYKTTHKITLKTTLTAAKHREIARFFQSKFGPLAGWAQSFLFSTRIGNNKTPSRKRKRNNKDD